MAFGSKEQEMLYLIACGYEAEARLMAIRLARTALDRRMLRRLCPYTGQHYFYEELD
jgi:hypothetical protein